MAFPFSTGEVINLLMVGVMIATLIYTRRRHKQEDDADVALSLNRHLLDCARKNGEVEVILKRVEKDIGDLNRKVENIGAQIRAVATGSEDMLIIRRHSGEPETK